MISDIGPETPIQTPSYAPTVALKKIGWAIAGALAAKLAGTLFQPSAAPYALILGVTPETAQAALTSGIFAVLVAVHDFVKLKTGWGWL